MKRRLLVLIGILGLWFLIHISIITIDGLSDNFKKADCILILGNTVNPNGTLSDRLKGRVDKGLFLYTSGYSKKIIVSGGLGKEGHYEGTVMKNYLVRKGVHEYDIIVDNNGTNTNETAENFRKIANENNFNSAIIVSQFFHITRIKLILKRKGLNQIYSAHADYFELRDFYSLTREFLGYYKYLLV